MRLVAVWAAVRASVEDSTISQQGPGSGVAADSMMWAGEGLGFVEGEAERWRRRGTRCR